MVQSRKFAALLLAAFLISNAHSATDGEAGRYRHARLKPFQYRQVTITAGFWQPIRLRSRDIGVPALLEQFKQHGHVENFRIVSQQKRQEHYGGPNSDEFLYKHLEAMGTYAPESDKIAQLYLETGEAKILGGEGRAKMADLTAIPYYGWANREPGRMKVWLPGDPQVPTESSLPK